MAGLEAAAAAAAVAAVAGWAWWRRQGASAKSATTRPAEASSQPAAATPLTTATPRPAPKHLVSKRPASGAVALPPDSTGSQHATVPDLGRARAAGGDPSSTPTTPDLLDPPTEADVRAARLAQTGVLTRVSCKDHEAMYGAMPPYGELSMDGDVLCYSANSRVLTKAAGNDGSQTLQSLGTVELGSWQLRLTRITGVRFVGKKALVSGREGEWELALLGPDAAELRTFCQMAEIPGA